MTTANRIKLMREKLNLSQQELATLVDINRASLSQIELWNRKISTEELTKFAVVFECDPNELLGEVVTIEQKNTTNDPHYVVKQLILYIASKLTDRENFWETLLNKLLYFTDFNYYEWTWELISNEKYIKMPYGPIPKNITKILEEMEQDWLIKRVTASFHWHAQKKVKAIAEPDLAIFDTIRNKHKQPDDNYTPYDDLPTPIEIVTDVLQKYWHWTASALSERSHNDIPYSSTSKHWEEIEPALVFYRKESFVSNHHNLKVEDDE